MNTKRRKRGVWVGGPPGRTMIKIKAKLAALGLDVVREYPSTFSPHTALPSDIDVVMFNHEMASHAMGDHSKAKAKERGIPFVGVSINTTNTIINLKNRGVIPMNAVEPDPFDDEDDDVKPDEPLKTNPFARALRDVVPADVVARYPVPVTSYTGASGGIRNEAPSATSPPASAVDRRVVVVDGWMVRERPGGDGCDVYEGNSQRGSAPVMVGDTVFMATAEAARFLDVNPGSVHRAIDSGGLVHGFTVRRAKFEEVVDAMPRLLEERERLTTPTSITPPAAKEEPMPEPKPLAPVVVPNAANNNTTATTLADEIAECMIAASKWPRLRRYILAALVRAEEEMNNTKGGG
jgi:hypothetical protein